MAYHDWRGKDLSGGPLNRDYGNLLVGDASPGLGDLDQHFLGLGLLLLPGGGLGSPAWWVLTSTSSASVFWAAMFEAGSGMEAGS